MGACGAPTEAPLTPAAPLSTEGPRIFFDEDFIDLGEATPHQPLHAEFHFQNVGDAQLVVYDVTKETLEGCWPPKPVVGSTTLQPGEESNINIDYVMGKEMEGPHLFEFTVKSNDPVEPEKKLLLKIDYVLEKWGLRL